MSASQTTVALKQASANAIVAGGAGVTMSVDELNAWLKVGIGIVTILYFASMTWLNLRKGKAIKLEKK
jgi:hypothetical protein